MSKSHAEWVLGHQISDDQCHLTSLVLASLNLIKYEKSAFLEPSSEITNQGTNGAILDGEDSRIVIPNGESFL